MALITIGFAACIARALWIQVLDSRFYQSKGDERVDHVIDLQTDRGRIVDRNGRVLATSVPTMAVWADASGIPDNVQPGKLAMLAQLLGISDQQLNTQIESDKTFVYLKHQISRDVARQVEELAIPGIYELPEYKRVYPEGAVTAQVVGFTDTEGRGEEGVELGAQSELNSVDGRELVVRDRVGHIVSDLGSVKSPQHGADIELALDRSIQYIAYGALRDAVTSSHAESGSAIVVDGHTGEVLALANYPSYDPNDRSALRGPALRNRAVTDVFEPGSIMKPLTVSLALDLGRLTPSSIVETDGRFSLDGAVITDDANFGTLTVAQVIQKSSNIGASKIALTMKPEEMWGLYSALGFGRPPKLGFPGAAAGIVRPWSRWRRIEQATMSYGYGVSMSLVQLAEAYTVFANNGRLVPLTLYKRDGSTVAGTQVFTQRTTDQMRAMLESVVSKGGTAPDAQVPGYSVGGKTGTAYTATRHGYERNAYRASFVGIIPIRSPRLVIAVSVDKPQGAKHFGGDVSGPVFARIAYAAMHELGVPPDMPMPDAKDGPVANGDFR
ncbi:penicillin-binding protein 2 [Paraburkholderia sp. JPY169]|uniref:Penicillin-binding protein 2 n=1 Tax=Paraburkholderia youngii TaxID=2782701 RepID=A0A7Y6N1C9_9BURK|nr:penicillin-binding protein 2 [Paraburkholderia youngii]